MGRYLLSCHPISAIVRHTAISLISVMVAIHDAKTFRIPRMLTGGALCALLLSTTVSEPTRLIDAVMSGTAAAATLEVARLTTGGKLGRGDSTFAALVAADTGFAALRLLGALSCVAAVFMMAGISGPIRTRRIAFGTAVAIGYVTIVTTATLLQIEGRFGGDFGR